MYDPEPTPKNYFTVFFFAFIFCCLMPLGMLTVEGLLWLVGLFVCIMAVWLFCNLVVSVAKREKPKEKIVYVQPPPLPPPPPPVPQSAVMEAARRRYDETLRGLARTGLTGHELAAAYEHAKRRFLKDLDEAMK